LGGADVVGVDDPVPVERGLEVSSRLQTLGEQRRYRPEDLPDHLWIALPCRHRQKLVLMICRPLRVKVMRH
jgi:hypothetical protein